MEPFLVGGGAFALFARVGQGTKKANGYRETAFDPLRIFGPAYEIETPVTRELSRIPTWSAIAGLLIRLNAQAPLTRRVHVILQAISFLSFYQSNFRPLLPRSWRGWLPL